ncbi:MAG TPA: helix-turn-helix transcriptional regulator [Solirubrobacterales bacterium]|jgi:transcriptional regulator with XRE-family HTH domain
MSRDGRIRSEEVAIKFGRNLWRCRRRAALSQEELGDRASLHRTEIGMLEHGTRLARVDTLMKLAGALSISPSELLEGIHWTPGTSSEGGFEISERTLPRRHRDDCS